MEKENILKMTILNEQGQARTAVPFIFVISYTFGEESLVLLGKSRGILMRDVC